MRWEHYIEDKNIIYCIWINEWKVIIEWTNEDEILCFYLPRYFLKHSFNGDINLSVLLYGTLLHGREKNISYK